MLSAAEATYVSTHAWLPEHLTEYVRAVSGKEPFLVGDFLCYRGARGLVVVGYPLSQALGNQGLVKALDEINRRFRPSKLWLLAPEIPSWGGLRPTGAPDIYFQLELENLRVPNKVRNMIRRAARELEVQVSPAMGKEHQQLIRDFIASKELSQGSQEILRALPRYVEEVADTVLLNLVDKADRLVSFCVGQMGKGDWGFYMFQVNSPSRRTPGSSDLLLEALIRRALGERKRFLNLGLGINPGVSFFKKKWGATALVPYKEAVSCLGNRGSAIKILLGGLGGRPSC